MAATDEKTTKRIIRAVVPADKNSVTLEMMPESGAFGQVVLTQKGLLVLIQTLGRIHASMSEGRDIPPLEVGTGEAIYNTRWRVDSGLMGEASLVTFHHPAFGPLGFLIPIDQVSQMIGILGKHVDVAAGMRQSPKN